MALLAPFSPATYEGGLPPIVTVTVSIDFLPLPAVITSSPQRVCVDTPRCWIVQLDWPALRLGTVILIWVSLHDVTVALTLLIITDPVPLVAPKP
ncbi:hypothetical protein LMG28138_06092 [Pararobbsia alpina]|uniref:Uncharacterized protein n=1 Tax=Pararobbsia alpina TaxID=621374 RepID=A0A6S7C3N5_9BURK|nr:hypothetical protein LMG28138_06092 [Pararobbsia alpina]